MTRYAELQPTSNFTFLRGASHPHELVTGAALLGMEAIGITDRNSLAGAVRAWSRMKADHSHPYRLPHGLRRRDPIPALLPHRPGGL